MASDRIQRRIDQLLDEADAAVTALDWDVVRARAQAVLAFQPDHLEALSYLEASNRSLGQSAPEVPAATAPAPTTAMPEQPTSFANGRYQVKRFLGEGGKKKVYLAQDTSLDREVAFALINTDRLR